MDSANILVIEDDDIVARTIERSLRGNEFRVTVVSSGVEGLKIARRRPPNLAIMDIIMPGMDGYTVCREFRADPQLAEVPILFLTAKIKDEDRIAGFNAGADDYLCKPFNIDELRLRVRAILRRAHLATPGQAQIPAYAHLRGEHPIPASPPVGGPMTASAGSPATTDRDSKHHRLVLGEYILDTRTYELTTPKRGRVRLTPVQYDLLLHLMLHPDEIFSPTRLLDEVWDYPTDTGSPDLVRVHIKNLRERIESDPRTPNFIRTVPGYGYTVG